MINDLGISKLCYYLQYCRKYFSWYKCNTFSRAGISEWDSEVQGMYIFIRYEQNII